MFPFTDALQDFLFLNQLKKQNQDPFIDEKETLSKWVSVATIIIWTATSFKIAEFLFFGYKFKEELSKNNGDTNSNAKNGENDIHNPNCCDTL